MTGFTASAFLSRNRVSPKEAFEGLELCEGKLSCTVLRGLDGSNPVRLLGHPSSWPLAACSHLRQCDNRGLRKQTKLQSGRLMRTSLHSDKRPSFDSLTPSSVSTLLCNATPESCYPA